MLLQKRKDSARGMHNSFRLPRSSKVSPYSLDFTGQSLYIYDTSTHVPRPKEACVSESTGIQLPGSEHQTGMLPLSKLPLSITSF